jgi:hypothetical protein
MKSLYFIFQVFQERTKEIIAVFLCLTALFVCLPNIGKAQGQKIEVFNQVLRVAGHLTSSQENLTIKPNREIEYVLELRNLSSETFTNSTIEIKLPYYAGLYNNNMIVDYYHATTGSTPAYDPVNRVITLVISYIPVPANSDSLLVRLTYVLVSSNDCYALNANCETEITVTGEFRGTGSSTPTVTEPFVYGYRNALQQPTTTPTKVTINDPDAVCLGQDFREYVYLEGPTTIPVSDISADYPPGAKFYDTIDIANQGALLGSATEYNISNGFPKTVGYRAYYARYERSVSDTCWQKFFINVLDTSDIVFCAGENIERAVVWASDWDAIVTNSGKWYLGTELINDPSQRSLMLADTNKLLTYQAKFVCDNSDITSNGVKIIVHDKPEILSFTQQGTEYCVGDRLFMEVNVHENDNPTDVTYTWTFGGILLGSTSASAEVPVLTMIDSGKYLTVIIANSCGTSTDSVEIKVHSLPVIHIDEIQPVPLCSTKTITLTVTPTGGTWKSLDPSIATVDENTGLIEGIAEGDATIRYIVTNANQCTDSAEFDIKVNALPDVDITGEADICEQGTVSLIGTPSVGSTLIWKSSDETVAEVSNAGVVTGKQAGTVKITYIVTNAEGCTDSSAVNIEVKALPTVGITGEADICEQGTVSLIGTPSVGSSLDRKRVDE